MLTPTTFVTRLQKMCYTPGVMPQDPFYWNREWRETRAEHLRRHPWCAICAAVRLQVPATDVDHVKAKELVADPHDHANLRSLCHQHHSQKTIATEGTNRGKKPFRVTGADGWPIPYGED
jgi:5-methylcytosine-specific restriction endonuclease McrA